MSSINDLRKSSFFDAQLCALGDWPTETKNLLEEWIETDDYLSKSKMAGRIISIFSNELLDNDSTPEGRSRISRLEKLVTNLENLVQNTKSITNKFYRDHLNHLIKVTLMSKCLAKAYPFKLDDNSLNNLLLASLFHDVSYPLTNSIKIFEASLDAIKDCYAIAEYYYIKFEQNKKMDLDQYFEVVNVNSKILMEKINTMNHGVYSAIEFMRYLVQKKEVINKYKEVIEAITLHDSAFNISVNLTENPVLGLLIIADELQDWGRPSILSNQIMTKIKDFELKDGVLNGTFIQYIDPTFSIFKQILGKWQNLNRIIISPKQFKINLLFEFRSLELLDITLIDDILIELFSNYTNKFKLTKEPALLVPSSFEIGLYGQQTKTEFTMQLFDDLEKKNPISSKYNFLINNETKELLISDYKLIGINNMSITNESQESLHLYANFGNNKIDCDFYDINNSNELYTETTKLLSKIRIINWLLFDYNNVFSGVPDEIPKYEGLIDANKITVASHQLSGHNFSQNFYNSNILEIQNCLLKGNVFFVKKL